MASSDHENDLEKNTKPDEAELVQSSAEGENVEAELFAADAQMTPELAAALEEVAKYRDVALRA
ncbi:MAG: hypothetical protein ACJAXW_001269, partial [Candidatus Azotimanducaceae bacterium]